MRFGHLADSGRVGGISLRQVQRVERQAPEGVSHAQRQNRPEDGLQARQELPRRGIVVAHVPSLESRAQTAGRQRLSPKPADAAPLALRLCEAKPELQARAQPPGGCGGSLAGLPAQHPCAAQAQTPAGRVSAWRSGLHPAAGAWPPIGGASAQGDWPNGAVVPQGRTFAGGKRETPQRRREAGGHERDY